MVDEDHPGGEDAEQDQGVHLGMKMLKSKKAKKFSNTFFSTRSLRMQFLISCKPPSLPRPSGISMVPRYPTYKNEIQLL